MKNFFTKLTGDQSKQVVISLYENEISDARFEIESLELECSKFIRFINRNDYTDTKKVDELFNSMNNAILKIEILEKRIQRFETNIKLINDSIRN